MNTRRPSPTHSGRTQALSDYLDGRLSVAHADRLEARLCADGELRTLLDDLRAVRRALEDRDQVEPDPALLARVLSRVGARRRGIRVPPWAIATSVLALALATLLHMPVPPSALPDASDDAHLQYHSVLSRVLNPLADLTPVITLPSSLPVADGPLQ